MDYLIFMEDTERKLQLTMPFMTKNLIKNRAEQEWGKYRLKLMAKEGSNKNQRKMLARKNNKCVSSFREKLNTLSSDFTCYAMETKPNIEDNDALFDLVYNLRPKTKPASKENDIYEFKEEESEPIQPTLPPLMSSLAKNLITTRKRHGKMKNQYQTKRDNKLTFKNVISKIENSPKIIEKNNGKENLLQISSKLIGEIKTKRKLEEENTERGNGVSNLKETKFKDDIDNEKCIIPLISAIEKFTDKFKLPNSDVMNLGGVKNNLCWRFTITNRSPQILSSSNINELCIDQPEINQLPTLTVHEDPYKTIGDEFDKLNIRNKNIEGKMRKTWHEIEKMCKQNEKWRLELKLTRNTSKIKRKIEIREKKEKKIDNNISLCDLFDDPGDSNRTLLEATEGDDDTTCYDTNDILNNESFFL